MGRVGVFTLLLASLSIGACSSEQSFRVADGASIRFSELRGDWVVLNYWAEWCAPCRKEIPELNELQEQALEQGIEFRVFGINYDGLQGADLDAVIERMLIDFPVLLDDPRQLFGIARAEVLPMTVIIDPNGKVKTILSGPQTARSLLASVES